MIKIGITGGIGSGKTTVCKIFELLDIPVFYADAEAKALMQTDAELISSIKGIFGSSSYTENGELNRKYLAEIVFNNESRLKELNDLVHPAVFRAFDNWVIAKTGYPYVLKEAALLFESKSYLNCHFNILVTSPLRLKIERIMKRDKITAEQVLARMNKQLDDDLKMQLADFIITNDEQQFLISQVLHLHHKLLTINKT